jgi:exopolysaccharide biosynthesis protein
VSVLLALMLTACGCRESEAISPLGWTLSSARTPLGDGMLTDTRSSAKIRAGLTQYTIEIGSDSPDEGFEINLGFAKDEAEAQPMIDKLKAAGYEHKLVRTGDNTTGTMVRVKNRYTSQQEADAVVADLKSKGVSSGRVYTAEDGSVTTGPYRINLLAVSPTFAGTIKAVIGTDIVPGKETTTSIAERSGAIAAINGGFFVVNNTQGTEGDLAGLSVINGRLLSESVEGRPALFIEKVDGRNVARVERKISTRITVSVNDGEAKQIDGTNRTPGHNFNCGNPFDAETSVAVHDVVCNDPNEIIVFTSDHGSNAVGGAGVEVAIDESGVVTAVSDTRGGAIAQGGQVLQGTGTGAEWLKQNIVVGAKVTVGRKLTNGDGKEIPLKEGVYAVNGGPTLLLDGGTIEEEHALEGWGTANVAGIAETVSNGYRANFFNGWYLRRNPRTAAGVAADGTILLMVADGRAPRYSAGLSIAEVATMMKYFGAVDAINLDGGGSSMMLVNGEPQTRPSDATGERADGDAIVISR